MLLRLLSEETEQAGLAENFDDDFVEAGPETDEPDQDIEEAADKDGVLQLRFEDEQTDEVQATAADLPYRTQAEAFMLLLLENTLSRYTTWNDVDRTCPLCATDDKTTDEQKGKQWSERVKLNHHMDSVFHAPVSKWKRRQALHRLRDPKQRWLCPYCLATGTEKSFWEIAELLRHVRHSTAKLTGEEHDRLKTEDGFYEDGFDGHFAGRGLDERIERGKRRFEAAGVHFDEVVELPAPIPLDYPGLQRGDFHPRGVPPHLRGFIMETDGPPPYTGNPLPGLLRETDGPPPYTGNPLPGILRETDGRSSSSTKTSNVPPRITRGSYQR